MRPLRGLIHAWHAAREQGLAAIPDEEREPLETEFRRAVTVRPGRRHPASGPKNQVRQQPGRELLEFCKKQAGRCPPVRRRSPAPGRRTTSPSAASAVYRRLTIFYVLEPGDNNLPRAHISSLDLLASKTTINLPVSNSLATRLPSGRVTFSSYRASAGIISYQVTPPYRSTTPGGHRLTHACTQAFSDSPRRVSLTMARQLRLARFIPADTTWAPSYTSSSQNQATRSELQLLLEP